MVCEMWIVDNDNFAFPNNSERCFSSVSYFKNLNGLNVKLFPGLPGTCSPVEVVKKVNSVSIWIFSTIGAWYDLRFPVSVLFSWVCMWYRLMFNVVCFPSFAIRFPKSDFRSLRRGGLFLSSAIASAKADRSN